MVLYFSGTGNSAYVAKRIGAATGDGVLDLFERIRGHNVSALRSERPWVVVAPTYAWRLPRAVERWLKETELLGSEKLYFVLTCGESMGNAGAYLEKLAAAKGLLNLGCAAVTMPENYIAMFETPGREEALETIAGAERAIDELARRIGRGEALPRPAVSWKDRLLSGAVNRIFFPACVHARKFRVTEKCISCGRCAEVCPLANIRMEDGAPVWGEKCTHCMACICRCPAEAIEYGRHSEGLPRYVCPK